MSYDNWWDSAADIDMGGTDEPTENHIKRLLNGFDLSYMDAIEIGSGKGRLISELAKIYPNSHFYGYEPSDALRAQAPKLPNVEYLPFLPAKRCGFIYSMLVFQHIPDEQKRQYIRDVAELLPISGVFRFQYVNSGDQAPRNFPVSDALIRQWCIEAGFTVDITGDEKYPQWSWCTAVLP